MNNVLYSRVVSKEESAPGVIPYICVTKESNGYALFLIDYKTILLSWFFDRNPALEAGVTFKYSGVNHKYEYFS